MAGAATALRLAIPLAFAGILFAAPVLLLPGVALVVLVAGCSAWVRLSAAGVAVRRAELPAQVDEGESFAIVVDGVSGRLPLVGRIEDEAAAAPLPVRVLWPRTRFRLQLEGSAARRGRHQLAAPVLRIGDPLGIAAVRLPAGAPASILVLPRIEPLAGPPGSRGPAVGRLSRGLGEQAAGGERESPADPELDGIRPYRPGTRATRIYWPALARGAGLAERHLVSAGDSAPLVALDPSGEGGEDLDRAVRAAASLIAHLARLGGCELLVGASRQRLRVGRDPRAWFRALAALAVVERGDGAPRLAPNDRRSPVIWVAAGPSGRAPAPLSRGFLVTPGQAAGLPAAFTVAGCAGYPLGAAERGRAAA